MLNGLYTITRGMVAFQKENDILANNLANVNTTGFKAEGVIYQSFPEILMSRLDETGQHVIGTKGTGSRIIATATDFRSGHMMKTDNPLDLAISGSGFFAVQTPNGVAYTRDGHFSLDEAGQIVTENGYLLLGANGPVQTYGLPVRISEDGIVQIEGMQEDSINLVDFTNLGQLEKIGDNLYRSVEGMERTNAQGIICQGFLEQSNVNVILGMTQLITATRLYEMSQKTIHAQDETLAKAVNEVGRVG